MLAEPRTPFGCYKNTIKLMSGKYLDLVDPQPDQFEFTDIAGALSKLCRFGGQIRSFYSVAEHSVLCACQASDDQLSMAIQRAALMHDATEAFIGDVVKPLKALLPDYTVIEQRIERVIADKFGIEFDFAHDSVAEIDHAMLIAERRALFDADNVKWQGEDEVRRLNILFECWPSDLAYRQFCRMATSLGIPWGRAAT